MIEQLVRRRKRLSISQEELSMRVGVTQSMVAKWETLIRIPSAFYLMCWCNALGVKIECVVE